MPWESVGETSFLQGQQGPATQTGSLRLHHQVQQCFSSPLRFCRRLNAAAFLKSQLFRLTFHLQPASELIEVLLW